MHRGASVHSVPAMPLDTWDTQLGCFLAYCRAAGQSAATNRLRAYYLCRLAKALNNRCPWEVTPDQLVAFVAVADWSPETRKSARGALRAFYGWAAATGRCASNPALALPRVRVPRGLPHPTPDQDLNRALAVASDRDRLMMMLAAYAGLRRAEIAALRWDDLRRDLIMVHGKGGRERAVPLHARLIPALAGEWEVRAGGGMGTGYRPEDPKSPYLFPGRSGGHITPGAVGKILARATGHSGHSLRHRFATRAYAATRDLRAVQELLGHTRPETTAIYTQVPDEALRAAVNAA